jgi:hypothetical protein
LSPQKRSLREDSDLELENYDEFLIYAPLKFVGVLFLAQFQDSLVPEKSRKALALKLDLGSLGL